MREDCSETASAAVKISRRLAVTGPLAVGLAGTIPASAQTKLMSAFAPRRLPARLLPVPDTVSPELRPRIAAPYPAGWDVRPPTAAAWKEMAAASAKAAAPDIKVIRERLAIRVEQSEIAGVRVFLITPSELAPESRDRLLVHVHGGGYVLFPGEAGAGEAMLMAGYGRLKCVSIDYRMPPDFPFPAGLDDAMAVWRALTQMHDPRKLAIFGSSAGGGMTLAMVLRAKAEGLPLPAAIAPGTPWADLTGDGDSVQANAYVDNVLVADTGWVGAAAKLYAGAHDLRNPLISPLYGDFTGFPPAIVTSGTRDLLLSHAVRVHRRLRRAGVDAALQVYEGQSHAQYLDPFIPETEEAMSEIAGFLMRRLAA